MTNPTPQSAVDCIRCKGGVCSEHQPVPAWKKRFQKQCVGTVGGEKFAFVPLTEDFISNLLKEERTATLCTRCHNPFQDHHWRISHRGEHYHTGCLEKTPARVTQLIEATRVATLREVFKELEKHNFKNLQVEDSIIKRLQHKLTSEL